MVRGIISALVIMVLASTTFAASAEGDSHPGRLTKSRGKTYYNYNIRTEIERDDDGTSRTVFRWDYVEIDGEITEEKIKAALRDQRVEQLTTQDLDRIAVDAGVEK